jgi:predicted transcriptional regulator
MNIAARLLKSVRIVRSSLRNPYADIQSELKKRGITQKEIAKELDCSEFHVSRVINKKGGSDRVMKAVAQKIKRDHHEVFPEYYFRTKCRKKAA